MKYNCSVEAGFCSSSKNTVERNQNKIFHSNLINKTGYYFQIGYCRMFGRWNLTYLQNYVQEVKEIHEHDIQ